MTGENSENMRFAEDPKDGPLEVKYGLPSEVQYCARCVISNQRPSSVIEFQNRPSDHKPTIVFDDQGICAACRYAEIKANEIDWEVRESELIKLCDRFRSGDGQYDCVVPGSGGKDSAFTAHILKDKYGMTPLTVTWSPHVYTDIGWRNFQNWIHIGGLDNILVTPNGRVHALLTRLAFENLLHPFQPFIIGQRMIGPRFSTLYNIPLVFYGENQAEYGNHLSDNFQPTMDMSFFANMRMDQMRLGGIGLDRLEAEYHLTQKDLIQYLPVDPANLEATGTTVHYLGYYIKWDPQEMYYYAVENCGFESNTERTQGSYSKYSSIDDKIDPLHYFTTLVKFGIGRATYDAAQEIRNGKILREEGVALVKRYDQEVPAQFLPEILDYMEIDEDRFWETIETFRSPHLWRHDGNEWALRHPIE